MLSNIVLKQYRNTHYRIAQCPQWRAGSMQQGATILNQLPAELLYAVVENLDLKDLSQLAMVNQQFWGFLRSMLYRVGTRKEYTRQGRSGSRTWLEFAVTRAHVELASQLLDRGGDPRLAPDTCLDGDYRTALFYAVQYGMIDLVERIGLRLDDVSKVYDRNGSTLLHAAVLSQAPTLVDHILGFDRPWGLKGIRSHPSALYLAACNGYTQIVSRLLVAGANLNQCGCSGTVLQAIMKDDSCKAIQEDIITMLVEKGDDLHKKDDDGRTILHYAACSHVPDVVNLLIKLGAILETRDRLGNTPLHEAAGKGRIENVKALITAGASVDATNWFDMTPLMVAMRWEHGAASVEYLASVKADINAEDRTNMTPIHAAVSSKRAIEKVMLLIGLGVSPEARTSEGKTPLHFAVRNFEPDIIDLLIEKGADINAEDNDGCTPLHEVYYFELYPRNLEMLHRYGADLNRRNHQGQTPLQLAISKGLMNAAHQLQTLGAQSDTQDNRYSTPFTAEYLRLSCERLKSLTLGAQHGTRYELCL